MPEQRAKVVLVTGAGRGLGRAIANRYREAGFTVVATDHDKSLLDDLDGLPGYIVARQDVSDVEQATDIARLIRQRCGRLDVIVNNAGVNPFYPVCEAPPQLTIQCFMVNTFAAVIVTQACLDLLIDSQGRVVNISSESSTFRAPFQVYQSSKMALECLSDVMRRELMLLGVHVAFIRPGAIRTELFQDTRNLQMQIENSRFARFFPRFSEMVVRNSPTRVSEPRDVAELVFTAGTDKRRRAMYTINNKFLYKVMARLPARLVDSAVARQLTAKQGS